MLGVVLLVAATLLATGSGRSKSWAVPILLSLAALSSLPALILAAGVMVVYLGRELAQLAVTASPHLTGPESGIITGHVASGLVWHYFSDSASPTG